MNNSPHAGFGLVEILVSLFIASLLMSVLMGCYLSQKKQYLNIQHELDVQFEVSWVKELLSDSVRRAGYTPCLNSSQLDVRDHRNKGQGSYSMKLNQAVGQIQINRMSDVFNDLLTTPAANKLIITAHAQLKANHSLMIADCSHAEIHTIAEVVKFKNKQVVYLTQPLVFDYEGVTAVGEWLEERWFIKKNSAQINTLHYRHLQTEELTEFIHSVSASKRILNGRILVDIILGLEGQKKHEFTVAVRGL